MKDPVFIKPLGITLSSAPFNGFLYSDLLIKVKIHVFYLSIAFTQELSLLSSMVYHYIITRFLISLVEPSVKWRLDKTTLILFQIFDPLAFVPCVMTYSSCVFWFYIFKPLPRSVGGKLFHLFYVKMFLFTLNRRWRNSEAPVFF